MNAMYKPNISTTERLTSTAIGAALAALAIRRENRLLGSAGLTLLARGVSGFCPVSAAVGRNTASSDTRQALSGSRGVIVEDAITIYRPIHEVYSYWRKLENLPRFMRHLEEVRESMGNTSRWVARGPFSVRLTWEAEIITDDPPNLISWRSLEGSDVVSAGSVRFRPAGGDHGTEVHVKLQYDPPAGKVGATVAWLLGEDPQTQIREDLRRFKQLLEAGEVSTGARHRTESRGRSTRRADASQILSDPIPYR